MKLYYKKKQEVEQKVKLPEPPPVPGASEVSLASLAASAPGLVSFGSGG